MAAPRGNQFWKLRSKHGREKLFSSPELLWEAACEYFQWCDTHPWIKKDFVGGGPNAGTIVDLPTARPYTLSGLCIYLGVNTQYLNQFKQGLNEEKKTDKDFSLVITHIEEIIRTQKFEGAAVGVFNANIISRDLGLVDKSDLTTKGDKIGSTDTSKLSDDDLLRLAEMKAKIGSE